MAQGKQKHRFETYAELEAAASDGELKESLVRRLDLATLQMQGSRFLDLDFEEVGLGGAMMREAVLVDCRLSGVAMRGVRLDSSHMEATTFRSCEGMEASFQGAELVNCRFEETPLGNADFSGAEVIGVVFSAAELYGAHFGGSVMVRSRFENRRLGNAILSRADFSGAILLDVDFSSADLAGCSFRDALLVRANFSDANLVGADFAGARLVDVNLTRVGTDESARAGLKAALVGGAEERSAVLGFLSARNDRMIPVIHALLVGYVLGRVTLAPASTETAANNMEALEAPVVVASQTPPASPASDPAIAPAGTPAKTESEPCEKVKKTAHESKELYERFKKIELD